MIRMPRSQAPRRVGWIVQGGSLCSGALLIAGDPSDIAFGNGPGRRRQTAVDPLSVLENHLKSWNSQRVGPSLASVMFRRTRWAVTDSNLAESLVPRFSPWKHAFH